jgi:DNA polymerase-3 subunit epsilon
MREIVLDTETTGLDPKSGHKVIEIGCVELINRVKTGRVYHTYINPERDVPKEAFQIHGISFEMLIGKPIFSHIAHDFIEFIKEDRLIIHNAKFDVNFLNHELKLLKRPNIVFTRVFDTLELARKTFPGSPASLNALCKRFNISLDTRDKHGALIDAHLLADVYIKLTGGSQTSFGFKAHTKTETIAQFENQKRTSYPSRNFKPTEEEIINHKQFLETIKEPVWNK